MAANPILWEHVQMRDGLPVSLWLRRADQTSGGCEFHWHEELELYYVRSGGVSLLARGRQTWLYPGDVAFVNWCEPHRGNRFLDGTQHYIIQISPGLLAQEAACPPGGQGRRDLLSLFSDPGRRFPQVFRGREELNALLDAGIREARERAPGYELALKGVALQVLGFLLRESRGGADHPGHSRDAVVQGHLKKVLAYLSAHCTQPEAVSLPALGRRFGLSVPYLCRIFKRSTNLTVTAYVNELRCHRAAALLQDGAALEEASAACGFRDYNYFSRLFKKTMGCPPSAYRGQGGGPGK